MVPLLAISALGLSCDGIGGWRGATQVSGRVVCARRVPPGSDPGVSVAWPLPMLIYILSEKRRCWSLPVVRPPVSCPALGRIDQCRSFRVSHTRFLHLRLWAVRVVVEACSSYARNTSHGH